MNFGKIEGVDVIRTSTVAESPVFRNRSLMSSEAAEANLDGKIVIEGITTEGRKFRPSDWAERMSGALSTFDRGRRIHYSPMLQPMARDGIKCVVIDPALKEANPELFDYIMQFARSNRLNILGEE